MRDEKLSLQICPRCHTAMDYVPASSGDKWRRRVSKHLDKGNPQQNQEQKNQELPIA